MIQMAATDIRQLQVFIPRIAFSPAYDVETVCRSVCPSVGLSVCLSIQKIYLMEHLLAGYLFNLNPGRELTPRFSDLTLLLETAKEVAKHASLAIKGLNTEFDDQAQRDRENAEEYAACVLDGLNGLNGLDGLDGLERVVRSP
jgi:hypothetical protein